MSSSAIFVEGLGKRYRVGRALAPYTTMRDAIAGVVAAPVRNWRRLRRLTSFGDDDQPDVLWALRDVSFEVEQGSVLGVIGRNGAGKTTLLKILARITPPTTGRVTFHARPGALLDVGVGFKSELTGRDNIYLNAAILGMNAAQIRRVFDEIVTFAEVEPFLETPMKHYSTGMRMRLAFSVAAHVGSDILLVDEVLSVGDGAFQSKCLTKMGEIGRRGRTVVFVSHYMPAITALCSQALWLDGGRVSAVGRPDRVIASYLAAGEPSTGERLWPQLELAPRTDAVRLRAIRVGDAGGVRRGCFDARDRIRVEIGYDVLRSLTARVGIVLRTADGTPVLTSFDVDATAEAAGRAPGGYRATCELPGMLLNHGLYRVSVVVDTPYGEDPFLGEDVLTFSVERTEGQADWWPGIVCPRLPWRVERCVHALPAAEPSHEMS